MLSKVIFSSAVFVILLMAVWLAPSVAVAQSSSESLIVEADDSLQWRRDEQQYIATGNAVARQGDITLRAHVITADYLADDGSGDSSGDGGDINITRITGTGNARLEGSRYQAQAENIVYDRGSKVIIATGSAEIILGDGQRLGGGRIEVAVNEAEDDVTSIGATGKARVFSPAPRGGHEAQAEHIDFTKDTGVAVLTGAVEVSSGGNRLSGDKAVINTLTGEATMTATDGRVIGVFAP